jgi:hypothetical protein
MEQRVPKGKYSSIPFGKYLGEKNPPVAGFFTTIF